MKTLKEVAQEFDDPDVAMMWVGQMLGIIPEDCVFGSEGKDWLYVNNVLTELMHDMLKKLTDVGILKESAQGGWQWADPEDKYLAYGSDNLDRLYGKNEMFFDEQGRPGVWVDGKRGETPRKWHPLYPIRYLQMVREKRPHSLLEWGC